MICSKCGSFINNNFKHCPYCGFLVNNKKINISNKSKIFLFTYYSIALLLMFISFFGTFISIFTNTPSEKLSSDSFISYMEDRGCPLVNELANNKIEGVDFYYKTDINSCEFQVGYILISNSKLRREYYDKLVNDAENNNNNITGFTKINTSSYNEYSTSGEYYKSVSLIEDNIFYINTSISHRNDALNIKKDLGYYKSIEINPWFWNLMYLSAFLIILLLIISWWKLNLKLGRKGWICLIPIYNVLCLGQDLFGRKIYGILLLIPIVNFVCFMIFSYRIGKVLGKNDITCLLMAFIPQIFIPIIAFDDSCISFSTI